MRLKLFMAAAMLSANLAAHADPVTILNGSLGAQVDGTSNAIASPNGFVAASGKYNPTTSISTTTGAVSSSGVAFTFTQAFEPLDYLTAGTGSVEFSALSGAIFSITDPEPVFGSEGISGDSFDTALFDLTTHTTLYDTNLGGSLTGTLVAGNEYTFGSRASVTAMTDPSLTYAPSISFTSSPAATPEPSSFLLLGTGLLGIAGMMRKRFA